MSTPRDYALGVVASIAILVGYSAFPSGTLFEWSVVAVAFLIGVGWAVVSRNQPPWREVGGLALASCIFIVVGTLARMWLNDFTLVDTVLLAREDKYVWSSLLPFGYWLLAGTTGYALARVILAASGKRHAAQ